MQQQALGDLALNIAAAEDVGQVAVAGAVQGARSGCQGAVGLDADDQQFRFQRFDGAAYYLEIHDSSVQDFKSRFRDNAASRVQCTINYSGASE
ncbi:hypothetical protein ACFQDL_17080 [Marinobacterium aestuariivivens]|uniref:Uncharacterized protein n=1 Tax=Marinobacterium aestuariivivens TaxID=1698799 RepID=A0ABW2A2C0_9GAMM